ncbi:MAG: type IV pilus modification PilV family protein [Acidobacteriota bacterium]
MPWPKKEKNNRRKKGITLIETLVSSTIIFLILLSTAAVLLQAVAVKHRSEARTLAAEKAAMHLEKMKSLPLESEELREGNKTSLSQFPSWPEKIILDWTVEDIHPNLKKIYLLCYSINHPQQKTEIILYLSKHLGF